MAQKQQGNTPSNSKDMATKAYVDAAATGSQTIGNTSSLTFKDTNFTLQDDGDTTKQIQFQLSGITTGQTRTLTVPDTNMTLVGTDALQTLTGKTISGASNTLSNIPRPVVTEVVSTSSASSLTLTTSNSSYIFNGSSAATWTLPAVSGNTGFVLKLVNKGTATVTVQRAGTDNMYNQGSVASSVPMQIGGTMTLVNDGTYWWVAAGYFPSSVFFDYASAGGQNTASTNTVTATWSHTAAGGADCVVVAMVAVASNVSNNPAYLITCTYGGVSMSMQGAMSYSTASSSFSYVFVLANPPTGSQTVTAIATLSGSATTDVEGTTVSYTGVNYYWGQPAALPHAAATSASMSVSSAPNHKIVQSFYGSATSGSWSAYNQNSLWTIAATTNYLPMVVGDASGAGTVTFSATGPSSQIWGGLAIDLSPQVPSPNSVTPQYDATGPGVRNSATAASLVSSWTHTSSPNAKAVVIMGSAVFSGASPGSVTITATYGGVTMTSLATRAYSGSTFSQMWMLGLINPPTGAQTVTVTVTCGSSSTIGFNGNSVSYTGVSSFGTAATNTSSGTALSLSVSSATGQMVAQAFSTSTAATGSITAYNQTFRYGQTITTTTNAITIGDAPGASTVSFTATTTSSPWVGVGVPLVP